MLSSLQQQSINVCVYLLCGDCRHCVCPASRHRAALPSLRCCRRAAAAVGVGPLLSAALHHQLTSTAQHGEEVARGRQGSPAWLRIIVNYQ